MAQILVPRCFFHVPYTTTIRTSATTFWGSAMEAGVDDKAKHIFKKIVGSLIIIDYPCVEVGRKSEEAKNILAS